MTVAPRPLPVRSVGPLDRLGALATDPRRVRRLGCVAFVVMGWVWALTSPLMAVPDEYAHAIRAVSIAHGQLLGRQVTVDPNGFGERQTSVVDVPETYESLETYPACHQFL